MSGELLGRAAEWQGKSTLLTEVDTDLGLLVGPILLPKTLTPVELIAGFSQGSLCTGVSSSISSILTSSTLSLLALNWASFGTFSSLELDRLI